MIRTNSHEVVSEFATHATVPVINALTDAFHPCQALADGLTILEHKGAFTGIKLVYIGDGNNVAHSLLALGAKTGMDVTIVSPAGHEVDSEIYSKAKKAAEKTGAKLELCQDPQLAVVGADVIYTDVWASMGFESEQSERLSSFAAFQVNEELLQKAKPDYLFLHCLPAHRGEEVTAEVIDGTHSAVYDQAENRLHVQKAVLAAIMSSS